MKKKSDKILYVLANISIVLDLIIIIKLLPVIYKSSWQGILLLVSLTLFLIVRLYFQLPKNKFITKILFLTLYLVIVFSKICISINFKSYLLFYTNIDYCKTNFLILSIAMIGICINSFINLIGERK